MSGRIRLRSVWRTVHLYTGLFAGAVLVLLGLTGSLLVFDHAIDEQLNPGLLTTEGAGPYRPLDAIVAAARTAHPEEDPALLMMPRTEGGVFVARFDRRTTAGGALTRVEMAIDPYTAGVLGQREWGAYPLSFIYKLHYTLWLGETGETLVGIVGLLLLVSLATGLYLWWPLAWPLRNGKLRRAITLKRGAGSARRNFDLHKMGGVYGALMLLVIAFSGVYMAFPEYVRPIVERFSALTGGPAPVALPRPEATPISVARAVAIAGNIFPGAELKGVGLPQGPQGVYAVTLRQPGEAKKSWGGSRVWIDPYTGEVLAVRDPGKMTAGDVFLEWQFPLHNGEILGLAGRVLVFITGFTPLLLYVTGIKMWLRRRRSNARAPLRAAGGKTTQGMQATQWLRLPRDGPDES